MSIHQSILRTCFTVLILSFIPTFGHAEPLEKVSLQLQWFDQFQFAGYYIAKGKGYYTDAGLDVTVLPFVKGKGTVVDRIVTGKSEYGTGRTSMLLDYHKGKPVVALAAILQDSPLVFLTRDDTGINTPQDLRGRKVMLRNGISNSISLMSFLYMHGLSRSDFQLQEHTFNIDDLINKKTDAMAAYISNQPFAMSERGIGYRIFHPKTYGLTFYSDILFTSKKEIQDNPERVQKFVKASLKGWAYAFAHIEETAKYIFDNFNSQNKSLESLIYEGAELRKLAYKVGIPLGEINPLKLKKIEESYRLMNVQLSRIPLTNFLWNANAYEPQASVSFTEKERKFIKNTVIQAATTTNWPPFAFVDKNTNKATGIGFDYWMAISKQAGFQTQITKFKDFTKQLLSLKNKQQDVMYSSGITEERKKFAIFSQPYASYPISIATSKDENFIPDASYLIGKKVAIGRNFTSHKMMVKAFPDITYIPVKNAKKGLQLVSQGEAYAYIDIMPTLAYAINKNGYTNLKISGNTGLMFELRLMVRNDYPELVSIANKIIASFDLDKKREIENRWINVQYQQGYDYQQYLPEAIVLFIIILIVFYILQRSKRRAQIANKAKSEFLATMSHEIRTPLNGVLGLTELVLASKLTAQQRENLETIHTSGETLLTVLNDILDYSKIEAGELKLSACEFCPNEMIDHITKLYAKEAHQKNIELIGETIPKLARHVVGDSDRLRQILMNLLNNAIKFTSEGEVVIKIKVLRETDKNMHLQFSVRDTGIGIKLKDQAKLFETFSQVDASHSRKYGGTGLGLSIVRKLVRMMGGDITVKSEENKGSKFTFSITLPKGSALPDPVMSHEHFFKQWRVLIVDDNATNRHVLNHMVSSWGMQSSAAENGKTALELLREQAACNQPYHLALIDHMMPEMDGLKLAHIIKKDPNLSGLKVVMLSSLSDLIDENTKKEHGLAAFLRKPIRQSALHNLILSVMDVDVSPTSAPKALASSKMTERILLAEDVEVNQQVAIGMLNNIGFNHVDLATNGVEAVEAFACDKYALILMDIQMPEMDGYEAVKRIRALEQDLHCETRTPIIALTAHAFSDNRKQCLAMGMDDLLTKPLTGKKLSQTIKHWLSQDPSKLIATPRLPSTEEMPSEMTLNKDTLRQLHKDLGCGIGDIIDLYIKNLPAQIDDICNAIQENDGEKLQHAAHSLKGSSANLGMMALASHCLIIEKQSKNMDRMDFGRTIRILHEEQEAALKALQDSSLDQVRG